VDKIIEASENYGGNLIEAGRALELAQKAGAGLKAFYKVIEDGKALLDNEVKTAAVEKTADKKRKTLKAKEGLVAGVGLSVCAAQLINDSRLAEYHQMDDEVASNNRISNLQELINAASEYPQSREGLVEFLEHIELDRSLEHNSKQADQYNAVTFITFHNTKGLEFKRVIMTGLEQGIFPREDKKGEELEEERRLFYVGATRAMEELYFTTCAERRMYGRTMPTQPSLFVRELDRSCLKIDDRVSGMRQPIAGKSFNPYNLNKAKKVTDTVAGWKIGQRIFHEDNGYGAVTGLANSEDGPVVQVRFDSGKVTRFLSEYQGRAFEKVSEDY
jgi:DNA helicase-2/ATP-dependent DNA helicase PcrA